MTISVVIPAYNGEKFLEKAILSTLHQTRAADEIIVHDDNSSDSTRLICEKYIPKVRYHFNSSGPSGFVNGWNSAIALAKCDYITILHQDDLLYPTFLEEIHNAIESYQDVRHIFSICNYINETGDLIGNYEEDIKKIFKSEIHLFKGDEYLKAYQKHYNGLPHIHRCPGVVTHRSIFENECKYNPEAGHIADDDFFYRVGQYTDVVGILKPFAAYRIHAESETASIGDLNLVRRLANDYCYQYLQWQNSTFIADNEFQFFKNNAIKFSKRLLYNGILLNNKLVIKESQSLIRKLTKEGVKCGLVVCVLMMLICIKFPLKLLSNILRFYTK